MKPKFVTATALLGTYSADLLSGMPPARYRTNLPFDALDLRPGRLILLGGAPWTGKTAALLQISLDILRLNPEAKLLIANAEMPPERLLDRILARLTSVRLSAITDRALTAEDQDRLKVGLSTLEESAPRLAFLGPPFDLAHVKAAGDAFGAGVFVLDYLQRFLEGRGGRDQREQLDGLVAGLRVHCDGGALVLAASAVARQRSDKGSGYQGLGLASFRGSSELEYGADACYVLDPTGEAGTLTMRCLKNRYSEGRDFSLRFEGRFQRYMAAPSGAGPHWPCSTPLAPQERPGTVGGLSVRRLTLQEVRANYVGVLPPTWFWTQAVPKRRPLDQQPHKRRPNARPIQAAGSTF